MLPLGSCFQGSLRSPGWQERCGFEKTNNSRSVPCRFVYSTWLQHQKSRFTKIAGNRYVCYFKPSLHFRVSAMQYVLNAARWQQQQITVTTLLREASHASHTFQIGIHKCQGLYVEWLKRHNFQSVLDLKPCLLTRSSQNESLPFIYMKTFSNVNLFSYFFRPKSTTMYVHFLERNTRSLWVPLSKYSSVLFTTAWQDKDRVSERYK